MTTALNLIQDAFELLKIYAPGVQVNAADSARAFKSMNKMLEQWSTQPYACYANLDQSFVFVPGKQSYTIGTSGGADIVATRPINVATGQGAAYMVDVNDDRFQLNVIEQDQWNAIGRLNNTSQLPDTMFYDPQFPLGIINIFPVPTIAYTMHFIARLQLADMANLNSTFSLPPGYEEAIVSNLAIRLWPYYKQGDPTAILIGLATESLGNVKRSNLRQSPATYDSAVVSKARSSYNIYNDASSSGRNS